MKSHDTVTVYVLEEDEDEDIHGEETLHCSIKLKEYFSNGDNMVYAKEYSQTMTLYDD